MADTLVVYDTDGSTQVTIEGADLLVPLVAAAGTQVGLAATQAGNAANSAAAAATNASGIADVRSALSIRPVLPVGWFDPTNYAQGAFYRNDFGVKFFGNGLRIFTMMAVSAIGFNSSWLDAANIRLTGDDGLAYQAVDMANVMDPCLAFGASVTTIHVSPAGNDTTGTGSSGSPYRTEPKARTIANATAGTYNIKVHCTGQFIGTETMPLATRTISQKITYQFVNDGGGPGWWCPGMRETYTAALFSWQSLGGGFYQCLASNASISAAAKSTPSIYDPSVLDSDGKPIASPFVAGTYADGAAAKAAIIAANGNGAPGFNYNTTSGLVVRLASGASPVPGQNLIYSELGSGDLWQLDDGARLCVRGFKHGSNIGRTSSSTASFATRPSSLDLGPTKPNVVHDIATAFADCATLGASGNAFQHQSGYRVAVVRCADYDTWLDAVNAHTIYNWNSNSISPDEGLYDHMFVDRHLSSGPHSGGDGRNPALSPTVSNSANGPTAHERGRMTIINSRFFSSNGSNCAIVTGAHVFSFGNIYSGVKTVDPSDQVFSAALLASDISAAGIERATIFSAYDSAFVPGDPTGRSAVIYAGPYADISLLGFNGIVTKVLGKHIKLTSNAADGNSVTIDGQTYTFRTSPSGAFDVQIGATNVLTVTNLVAAINANATGSSSLYARQNASDTSAQVRKLLMFGQDMAITASGAAITANPYSPTITELSGFGGPPGAAGPPLANGSYGDVVVTGNGGVLTVAAGAITASKMANVSQATIRGRASGAGTGSPQDLSAAQVKAILSLGTADISGLGTAATLAFDTDGTLAHNGDDRLATQKAIKTYVDNAVAGGGPTGSLLSANDLSDVVHRGTARANLGAMAGNLIRGVTAGAAGTGAFTPSAAATDSRAWSSQPAGFYLVRFDDVNAWELSFCYWNGTTLSRSATQFYDSSSGSLLTLTSAATATHLGDAFDVPSGSARHVRLWSAGPGLGTPTAVGMQAATVTGTGSSSGGVAGTNALTERARILYTSLTTANAQAGLSTSSAQTVVSTTAGRGGWELQFGFGASALPTGPRLFLGSTGLTFVANTGEPSALTTNLAAIGLDSTDTHLQLLTNNGTGGCTKIDTGITFAINDWYKAKIWIDPGSNRVNALVARIGTGEIFFATTTTDVPVDTAGGLLNFIGGLSSTTGTAIVLHVGSISLRSGS